jgi:hypothetical protein
MSFKIHVNAQCYQTLTKKLCFGLWLGLVLVLPKSLAVTIKKNHGLPSKLLQLFYFNDLVKTISI